MKSSLRNLLLIVVSIVVLSACKSGGGGSTTSAGGGVGAAAWYDASGQVCGTTPRPGCNFYADGRTKIRLEDDPSWNNSFRPCGGDELPGDCVRRTQGPGWSFFTVGNGHDDMRIQSPSGTIYNVWVNANYEPYGFFGVAINSFSRGKVDRDALMASAEDEEKLIQEVGKDFASRYALSEVSAVRFVRAAHDLAAAAGTREVTEGDYADFAKRAYGVEFKDAAKAYGAKQGGDSKMMDALYKQAANYLGTTPESVQTILRNQYGKLLD